MADERLLVGPETLDDAGVYRLDEETALIHTVDFFTPLVDDPYDFGSIAAANALSDVYAMGGVPVTALALMCFPGRSAGLSVMREIIRGGMDKMHEAGTAVAGGHSVIDKEIKFGFAVTGRVHPSRILRVCGAEPGDVVLLTKPVGTGVLAHTLKAEGLEEEICSEFIASMKELNAAAGEILAAAGARACTDVTGFGLLGHALNMARSSKVCVRLFSGKVPVLTGARECARRGMKPGGLQRNRKYVEPELRSEADPVVLDLMCDPQTSGGLLAAVPRDRAEAILETMRTRGCVRAAAVGEAVPLEGPHLEVS